MHVHHIFFTHLQMDVESRISSVAVVSAAAVSTAGRASPWRLAQSPGADYAGSGTVRAESGCACSFETPSDIGP